MPPLIFVVDDDPAVGRALKRLLCSWGMRARSFSSGEAFLSGLAESQAVDCAVLDVKMPGMTGLEVRDHMAHAGWDIPVIFITAHEDPDLEGKALGGGAIGFLRKPFTDEALMALIYQALRHSKSNTRDQPSGA